MSYRNQLKRRDAVISLISALTNIISVKYDFIKWSCKPIRSELTLLICKSIGTLWFIAENFYLAHLWSRRHGFIPYWPIINDEFLFVICLLRLLENVALRVKHFYCFWMLAPHKIIAFGWLYCQRIHVSTEIIEVSHGYIVRYLSGLVRAPPCYCLASASYCLWAAVYHHHPMTLHQCVFLQSQMP